MTLNLRSDALSDDRVCYIFRIPATWGCTNPNGYKNRYAHYTWNESAGLSPKIAACGNVATTYLLMDKGNNMTFTGWWDWVGRAMNTVNDNWQSLPGPHSEGKAVGFADGHTKWMKSTSIQAKDVNNTLDNCIPGYNPNSPYYSQVQNN